MRRQSDPSLNVECVSHVIKYDLVVCTDGVGIAPAIPGHLAIESNIFAAAKWEAEVPCSVNNAGIPSSSLV